MITHRLVKMFVAFAVCAAAALTAREALATRAVVPQTDRSFHTPQTSDYAPVGPSVDAPQTADDAPLVQSIHTSGASNYPSADRSPGTLRTYAVFQRGEWYYCSLTSQLICRR